MSPIAFTILTVWGPAPRRPDSRTTKESPRTKILMARRMRSTSDLADISRLRARTPRRAAYYGRDRPCMGSKGLCRGAQSTRPLELDMYEIPPRPASPGPEPASKHRNPKPGAVGPGPGLASMRPREKLRARGPSALSDAELLALL